MSYENIKFQTVMPDGIATIKFDRPKALNALNSALFSELSDVLDEIAKDEAIKVLIITGAGEKAFIAGADIKELSTMNPLQAKAFSAKGQKTMAKFQQLPIPVIAAVNGFALGGGSEMALSADFIYASEDAKFGLPEINLGIIPGFGGTQKLPRIAGKNMAKEMIFTGNMISAQEALRIGMVNKVFTPDKLMEETIKTAHLISLKGKASLRAAKYTVNRGVETDIDTGCDLESDAFGICMSSDDAKEGITAFIEKRKAEFKGKLNQ